MALRLNNLKRITLWGICLIVLIILFTISGCNIFTMKFNHDTWIKANDDESWDIRKKMAQDLVDNEVLVGKSKQEVIKMLGASEEYSNVSSNELYYTIELDYGWDIDPVRIEYLIVSLDSNNRVTKVYRKIKKLT